MRTWHRPLLLFAGLMTISSAVSAVGLIVDDRMLVGAPIWAKPLKFSVSFVAYALSLAWLISQLTPARRTAWWAGTVVAAASAGEMVVIIGQVLRGKRSHFNNETGFDATLFNLMGITIVVLWAGSLLIAALLLRSRTTDRAAAWAVRAGSVLALTGAGLGFLMVRPTPEQIDTASDTIGAHSVGVPDGGPGMPLTGWSTTGGDLRVPHFVGMHALQLLPLLLLALLLLAPRLAPLRDARVRARLMMTASAGYAALLALLTWQALRGQPLVHPDGLTLTAAALIAVGTAIGAATALRGSREAWQPPDPPIPPTGTATSGPPGTASLPKEPVV